LLNGTYKTPKPNLMWGSHIMKSFNLTLADGEIATGLLSIPQSN
jgi:hypothetical protein